MLMLLIILVCPFAANAENRQEVSGTWKVSELTKNRLQLIGDTKLIVDEDIYLPAVYGSGPAIGENPHSLEIVTEKGKTLKVGGQSHSIDVKNLTISGEGVTEISAVEWGVFLYGGTLTCNNTTVVIKAYPSEDGMVCKAVTGTMDSNILIDNSDVTIISPDAAVSIYKQYPHPSGQASFGDITVRGAKSRVTFNGSIGWTDPFDNHNFLDIGSFNVEDGVVTVNTEKGSMSTIDAERMNLTGGDITVNRNDKYYKYVFDSYKAIECLYSNIQNCKLTVNSSGTGLDDANYLYVDNAIVNVTAEGPALWTHAIKITGDKTEVYVSGGTYGIKSYGIIDICCHKLQVVARNPGKPALYSNEKLNIDLLNQNSVYHFLSADQNPVCADKGIYMSKPCDIRFPKSEGYYTEGASQFTPKYTVGNGNTITMQAPSMSTITMPWTSTELVYVGETRDIGLGAAKDKITWEDPEIRFQLIRSKEGEQAEVDHDYGLVTLNEGDWHDTKVFRANEVGYTFVGQYNVSPCTGWGYTDWAYKVVKHDNLAVPVTPELSWRLGSVWVTNPHQTTGAGSGIDDIVYIPQEYIVLDTFKDVASLTEEDWKDAETPEDFNSSFKLRLAASGRQLFVYTRYKETNNFYAGNIVAYNSINSGAPGTETKNVRFKVTPVNGEVTLDQEGVYIVRKGQVVRIDELSIPDNATDFMGSAGWAWLAPEGVLFEDVACSKPVDSQDEKLYKTVYFKPKKATTHLVAQTYIDVLDFPSPSDGSKRYVRFIVTEEDGTVPLLGVTVNNNREMHVAAGETREFPFTVYPLAASNQQVSFDSFTYTSVEGATMPGIKVDNDRKTLTIDCTDCDPGLVVGAKLSPQGGAHICVDAVSQRGIAVNPQQAIVDPTVGSIQLTAVPTPANSGTVAWYGEPGSGESSYGVFTPTSVDNVTWKSGNESIATVDENGLVTFADDPGIIGETVTITATSGDYTATSTLTLGGQKYDLWIAGIQMNEFNRDDILGDGKVSFKGNTLTLDNATIDGQDHYAILSSMPTLNINLRGDNKLLSDNLFSAVRTVDVTFMGYGLIDITSDVPAAAIWSDGNVTVTDTVEVVAAGKNGGVRAAGTLSIDAQTAELRAKGSVSSVSANCIIGKVIEPEGAAIAYSGSQTKFTVKDAAGNTIQDKWVVFNAEDEDTHLKGDVNEDNKVDISDVVAVINQMAGQASWRYADVNGDANVDISDIVNIINIMAGQ